MEDNLFNPKATDFFFFLINHRNFFLIVLEAASPRSGCQHGQVLVPVLLGQTAGFPQCPHTVQGPLI